MRDEENSQESMSSVSSDEELKTSSTIKAGGALPAKARQSSGRARRIERSSPFCQACANYEDDVRRRGAKTNLKKRKREEIEPPEQSNKRHRHIQNEADAKHAMHEASTQTPGPTPSSLATPPASNKSHWARWDREPYAITITSEDTKDFLIHFADVNKLQDHIAQQTAQGLITPRHRRVYQTEPVARLNGFSVHRLQSPKRPAKTKLQLPNNKENSPCELMEIDSDEDFLMSSATHSKGFLMSLATHSEFTPLNSKKRGHLDHLDDYAPPPPVFDFDDSPSPTAHALNNQDDLDYTTSIELLNNARANLSGNTSPDNISSCSTESVPSSMGIPNLLDIKSASDIFDCPSFTQSCSSGSTTPEQVSPMTHRSISSVLSGADYKQEARTPITGTVRRTYEAKALFSATQELPEKKANDFFSFFQSMRTPRIITQQADWFTIKPNQEIQHNRHKPLPRSRSQTSVFRTGPNDAAEKIGITDDSKWEYNHSIRYDFARQCDLYYESLQELALYQDSEHLSEQEQLARSKQRRKIQEKIVQAKSNLFLATKECNSWMLCLENALQQLVNRGYTVQIRVKQILDGSTDTAEKYNKAIDVIYKVRIPELGYKTKIQFNPRIDKKPFVGADSWIVAAILAKTKNSKNSEADSVTHTNHTDEQNDTLNGYMEISF